MIRMLTTFAALSMAGTIILSLLPEGGIKRTAGMAVGFLTLACWAEGIASLLNIDLPVDMPSTALVPTTVSVQESEAESIAAIEALWEVSP